MEESRGVEHQKEEGEEENEEKASVWLHLPIELWVMVCARLMDYSSVGEVLRLGATCWLLRDVVAAHFRALPEVQREGWILVRKGLRLVGWRKRWLSLGNGIISLYNRPTKPDIIFAARVMAQLKLDDLLGVSTVNDERRPHQMKLCTLKKIWQIQVEREADRDAWIHAICMSKAKHQFTQDEKDPIAVPAHPLPASESLETNASVEEMTMPVASASGAHETI